ncbi:MAG: response regulator [Desulfobacterales bacterium]|nr:response regulator [Desulfobacterales bacterium]
MKRDRNLPCILVVDDEADIRKMISRHFRFIGYDVIDSASNGKEALDILAAQRVEVVISDIQMPVMNGLDLLRTIRREYPMVHVIIITGYVTIDNLLSALKLGADTCVFKPIEEMGELEDAVSAAVASLRSWQVKMKTLLGMRASA